MATPQTGIFALGTASHAYLEMDLLPGADASTTLSTVASLREPRTTIGGVNVVVGFRPELWRSVEPDGAPPDVASFDQPVVGLGGYELPATQHDIVIWLSGSGYDVVFDLSRTVVMALSPLAGLAHEMVGWPYHHDLDLTGFVDGTENPSLVEATGVVTIPDGRPGEGGSVLLLQQWEHDAIGWESLPSQTSRRSSAAARPTASSSIRDPRPRTSRGPIRTTSGRSSGGTSPMERCSGTGRSSSASAATSRRSRRCSKAWSVSVTAHPTSSRP